MSLSSAVNVDISSTLSKSLNLSTPSDVLSIAFEQAFTDGTGDDQANRVWHDKRTIAGGASDVIDLRDALTDALGDACNFARVKLIFIQNLSAVNPIFIMPDANAPWEGFMGYGSQLLIEASGMFLLVGPKAIGYTVAVFGDKLKIENLGGTATDYIIVIIGASA